MNNSRSQGFTAGTVPEAYDRFMTPQLFEPWARELVSRAPLQSGSSVLDVASGTGAVARLAASVAGPNGRVVANDISPAMLAVAAAKPFAPTWAPVDHLECSVTAIEAADASFDVVFCQQGLQFFPDRAGSLREMCRVARRNATVVVSTWARERPLGLFGPMTEAMQEAGIDEPFPRAFDPQSYSLSADELRTLLSEAGLREVLVETVELDAVWPDTEEAVAALMGTPFGPSVAALSDEALQRVQTLLAERLGRSTTGPVTVRTTSHIGRGVKQ